MLLMDIALVPSLVIVAAFGPPTLPTATFDQEIELGEVAT
jgi:hypothetical protein